MPGTAALGSGAYGASFPSLASTALPTLNIAGSGIAAGLPAWLQTPITTLAGMGQGSNLSKLGEAIGGARGREIGSTLGGLSSIAPSTPSPPGGARPTYDMSGGGDVPRLLQQMQGRQQPPAGMTTLVPGPGGYLFRQRRQVPLLGM